MDARMEPERVSKRIAIIVAALAFLGYFGIARIVGNLYPFSTFPMYAGEHRTTGSRIVAKDAAGALHEVTEGMAWSCGAREIDPEACGGPDVYTIDYVDREAVAYVREHSGGDANATPVELVRHIWTFASDRDPPTTRDCPIALCSAVLRR
jgi:hypothetical protein